MSFFKIDTKHDFGKYKGSTLRQIFLKDPSYIDWCLRVIDYYRIYDETLEALENINPQWSFSKEARKSVGSDFTPQYNYRNKGRRYIDDYDRLRITQHPELEYRPEHEAIELIDLADEIGCEPEDLTANLDM